MTRTILFALIAFLFAVGCDDKKNTNPDINEDTVGGDSMAEVDEVDGMDSVDTTADEDLVTDDGMADTDEMDDILPDGDDLLSDEQPDESDTLITDTDSADPLDLDNDPDTALPAGDIGIGLYFSAHVEGSNYGDIYRLKMDGLTIENITNTADKFEYCPALPADASFLLYSSADYSDTHLGSIWKANLSGQGTISGQPAILIARELKEYDVYGDGSVMQQYTVGRWNPAVSEDGTRIVFTGTYETGETDLDGYLTFDIELFTADGAGENIAPFLPTGDGNPMYMKPLSAEFVHGTDRIMASFLGFGPEEISSEIFFEDEGGADMTAYTFYGAWTDGNVAQRGLAAATHADEMLFYRFVPDLSVQNGLSIMGNIVDAPWNETYTGYRQPDETFVAYITTEQFASHYRPFAFSPDGNLIAVTIYTGSGSDRESRLAIIGRDGTVYRVFNLDNTLWDIDGLIWR